MISDTNNTEGLGFFLYRSTARDGLTRADLRDILSEARRRNQELQLTGCLHYEDGLFFQWLEGPADGLWRVVDLIRADTRHHDLTVLGQGALDYRRFLDWRMRFTERRDLSLLDWIAASNVSTVEPKAFRDGLVRFLQQLA